MSNISYSNKFTVDKVRQGLILADEQQALVGLGMPANVSDDPNLVLDPHQLEVFYDGFSAFRDSVKQPYKTKDLLSNSPEERLVSGLLPYLAHIILKEHGRPTQCLQLTDRFQNAALYASEAAPKYDPTQRASFIGFIQPYLASRIKGLEQGDSADICQADLIRVPGHVRDYYTVRAALAGLSIKLGQFCEPEDVIASSRYSFTPQAVKTYKKHKQVHIPFESAIQEVEAEQMAAGLINNDPHNILESKLPKQGVDNALDLLNERESFTLIAHLGLNGQPARTLSQIAPELGCSSARVQQIASRALEKLRSIPNIIDIIHDTVLPGSEEQANSSSDGRSSSQT